MAHAVGHALALTGSMTWEILWALILGFTLSAVVQAVVRRSTIVALLGDDRPRTLAVAAGLGAASSSCSYAAVALARSLFRKGANFTAAMAFEIGSTNLVVELGIILALLMGWQFTAAEFIGGPLMIVVLAVLFRLFVRSRLIDAAREQADRGLAGSMEGHAAMDMSVQGEGSFWRRLLSREASPRFLMCSSWVGRDPARFGGRTVDRRRDRSLGARILLAALLFRRSPGAIGVVGAGSGPRRRDLLVRLLDRQRALAAVLWNGGISFGGVVSFIFADLLILPILNIYRKYYGTAMMFALLGTFYGAMVVAGYLVELLFGATGLIPSHRNAMVMEAGISWNYTTWLNVAFLALAALLVVRFVTTGGIPMLRMMNGSPDDEQHGQHCH
ncbi:membrane protein [Mycobacterium cookii]|uniref:Membrane protein n=1 Tax=Mycobacterium cookii TaxID=1775 RepID=A0A7I7KQ57_9MYCO|nr:membrane protein [Mycobacterium cookii]